MLTLNLKTIDSAVVHGKPDPIARFHPVRHSALARGILRLFLIIMSCGTIVAATVDITVLQTTDIHAHINYGNVGEAENDWLRLASVVEAERDRAGGTDHCLLIDCGDTIQGHIAGAFSRGELPVKLLNALQYDAWIPGNHELEFGITTLESLTDACTIPVLAANLRTTRRNFPGYRIYHKAGTRIAVIGITASYLRNWLWGDRVSGYIVENAVPVLESLLPEIIRREPDMIILAIHQGLMESDRRRVNEVREIINRFPQIDLVLGGHTHREFPGRRVRSSWYVQAGAHAASVARITATIDTEADRVVRLSSILLPTRTARPHDRILQKLAPDLQRLAAYAARELTTARQSVRAVGEPGVDCEMSDLICRAIAWKTGATMVFHGRLSDRQWNAGTVVTESILFDTVPYENGIGIARLTSAEILTIMKEQLTYRDHRSFNGAYGAQIMLRSGVPVAITMPDRPGLDRHERIPVAFNSYTIAGGGGRFPHLRSIVQSPAAALHDTGLLTRDILREYIATVKDWRRPPKRWLVTFDH